MILGPIVKQLAGKQVILDPDQRQMKGKRVGIYSKPVPLVLDHVPVFPTADNVNTRVAWMFS